MTTVWRTTDRASLGQAAPPRLDAQAGWAAGIADLQDHLDQARSILGAWAEPGLAAVDQACRALSAASDDLMTVLVGCGVETPLGWRLHNLRNRLDAHLLAADALRDAEAPDAVITVLRRTVDFVGIDLDTLLAPTEA